MINPLRSEEDAFRFTLIVAVLLAPVVLAAIVFSTAPRWWSRAASRSASLVGLFVLKREEPQDEGCAAARAAADDTHRILVVANETLGGSALRARDRAPLARRPAPSCASSAPL